MNEEKEGAGRNTAGPALGTEKQLAVLLTCFDGRKTAGKARHSLDAKLKCDGDSVLDSSVVEVNAKHKASGHDPRRVVAGALTAALTWGLFGLVLGSDGWASAIIWAVIGAACGGLFSYYSVTHLSKGEWKRIGERLSANSSALSLFVETNDARRLLEATGSLSPSAASVAVIGSDLRAQVFAGATSGLEVPGGRLNSVRDRATTLSMVIFRYSSGGMGKQIAAKMAPKDKTATLVAELIVERDHSGLHVTDPEWGSGAWSKSDLVSWGLFGVAVGFLTGLISGGIFGAVGSGVKTGLIWAAFGLFAGALYGLWAGRAVSARRLKSAGSLLGTGESMVLAWSNGAVTERSLEPFLTPGSQRLVLCFNSVDGGALLEAA